MLVTFLTVVSLTGCDVESYDDAVNRLGNSPPPAAPPPPGSPPPPPPPPTGFGPNFSEIQTNVFTPSCASSSCHGGAGPAAGLNLESASSYAGLVGIVSTQDGALQMVNPGNPDISYLIQKMEGTHSIGDVMPPSGAILQASIDTIRQWITDGAIDDGVAALDPIQVSSLAPAPNATLTVAPPTQIIAGFTRELVASSVDATTFILESSGGDGSFIDGTVVPIVATSISIPVGNPQTAVFDLTGVVLANDIYRVRLLGDGGVVISDLDANALDGEFVAALPSGNGTAGGDFEAFFTVAVPVPVGPTLAEIQAAVFGPTCSVGCHNGIGAVLPGVMNLSDANASFMALVGVPSIQQAAVLRVAAGDPDGSYLIRKLENAAGINGGPMPPLGALDPATILAIRQWITDGALQ